jgi:hypothetical protein
MEKARPVETNPYDLAMVLKHGMGSREVADLERAINPLSTDDQAELKRILDIIILNEIGQENNKTS